MKKSIAIVVAFSLVAGLGCATSPKKIPAAYVSPLKYKDYDYDQVAAEMDAISRRTNELYYSLRKDARNDKWQMGVGMLLFWPTLFLLEGGDGPEAAEFARLKGEYEALRQVAVQKKFDLNTLPPSPEETIKAAEKEAKENKKNNGQVAEASPEGGE